MKKIKIYESKAWLELEYLVKGFTVEEISKKARCSKNTIRENLKKFEIIKDD